MPLRETPEKFQSVSQVAPRSDVELQVFDSVEIVENGRAANIGGRRQRRLLALLVVRANTIVSTDWLIEYLWDDSDRPKDATAALRTYISRLRRALPEGAQDWLETEALGYRLAVEPRALEHARFRELRRQARKARDRGDVKVALRLLDEALTMWRGIPFHELEDLDWVMAETQGLQLERLEMMEERWEAALNLGLHTQIVGELATFNAEHTLRERARSQQALALHRSGRTHEAVQVLQDYRAELADAKGFDPSRPIAALESALLAKDPKLDLEQSERPLRGYRLLELIGEGAFSQVWRGVQPSVNRSVAIKQIRSGLASRPGFIRRFEAEAQMVARIEHPHIVPLIDFWRDPDSAYLVMRWLRGGTLEQKIGEGRLSHARTVQVGSQIGGALAAAHHQGVVHRDVKSANIFLDEVGNAFLGDFGIALDTGIEESTTISYGSPAYASPEQLAHANLGPRSDVFSLGVVLFECLTGSLPFPDSTSSEELARRQVQHQFPRVTDVQGDLPASVADVIARATQTDPAGRFDSVTELVEALQATTADESAASIEAMRAAMRVDVVNPYRGLRAFGDEDAERFFGREAFVDELLSRLVGDRTHARAVIVVGPSGSGKSSAVRAGLIPALRRGAVPGSEDWFVTSMVPGSDPFDALESALRRVAISPPDDLNAVLTSGSRGIANGLMRSLGSATDQVVLFIDQFEEVFSAPAADEFLAALAEAVDSPSSPLRLIATLRADFYDRPLQHQQFSRLMKRGSIDLLPLEASELERVIVEPSGREGVRFEAGLVSEIVTDTLGHASALPLLQHVLSELFDSREGDEVRRAEYRRIGGISGALAGTAEEIYATATEGKKGAVQTVFERLTRVSDDGIDLRRRISVSDLREDAATAWVLETYGAARLLSFDRDSQTREPTVEVAHEALMREWPRLVRWLEDDRDLLRSLDGVAVSADAWRAGGREPSDLYWGGRLEEALQLQGSALDLLRPIDREFVEASETAAQAHAESERRRWRILRTLLIGFGVALLLALIAGGVAVLQRSRADTEAARAVEAANIASDQRRIAEEQELLANQQKEVAEAALRDVDTLTDELESIIVLRGVGDEQTERLLELASTIDFATAPQNDIEVTDLEIVEVTDKSAKVRYNTSECSDAIWTVSRFGSAGGVALDRCSESHQLLLGRSPFSSGPLAPDTTYFVDVAGVLDDGSRSAAKRIRFTTLPEFVGPPQIRDLAVSEVTETDAVVTFKVDQCTGAEFQVDGVTYHADGYPGRQDLCWVNQWARIGTMPIGPGPLTPGTMYTVDVQAFLVDGSGSLTKSIEFQTLGG